jgi:Ca-activated chloride channel homolog
MASAARGVPAAREADALSFSHPILLVFLLAVPAAVAAYLWHDRGHDGRAASWATPALLPNMVARPPAWRRHLPIALLLVGTALLLVGFARPQATITVKKQDATVVLVLDVSGSMAARDSTPTRLAAARKAAKAYVDELPKGHRMSLITFSDHTTLSVPPSSDLDRVRSALDRARTGPQGTALADAVSRAVAVAKAVPAKPGAKRPPAVIVVFSDGGQTAGRVTPQQAAQQARDAHIPVTAVSVGTPDGIVKQPVQGGFTERIQVPVKPDVLQTIARTSGGRFVQGAKNVDTKVTYDELGSRVGHKHKTVEVTSAAAAGGLVFMLAGAVFSGLWFRRVV